MNHDIIKNLSILSQYYEKTGDSWRSRAYQRAIFSIRNLDFEINNINQIKSVKGIGKSIKEKIDEYLNTGRILKADEVALQLQEKTYLNSKEKILEKFQNVWGIGPAKANELYKIGMRSLDDLHNNLHLLTDNQKIGLKHYNDLLKSIPRKYIDIFQIAMRVVMILEFGYDSFRMQVAGSYRRGEKESGDIDCLITSKVFNLEELINVLIKWDIVTDVLSMRQEKFMGIVHCPSGQWYHFRMDIEFLPEDEFYSGLLYFTGSKNFNVSMRMDAKKQGYILNQHGLFDQKGNRIPAFTEEEIMAELGMQYIEPNKR